MEHVKSESDLDKEVRQHQHQLLLKNRMDREREKRYVKRDGVIKQCDFPLLISASLTLYRSLRSGHYSMLSRVMPAGCRHD